MHTCPSYFAKNSCKPEPCNVSSSGKSSKNAGGNAAAIFSVEIERYQKSADCSDPKMSTSASSQAAANIALVGIVCMDFWEDFVKLKQM
ncbi:hypothetical protein DCAR_0933294 [Daucus carota subsp. sativus]|uniref:Uncharacterized protein n=1 Tax=Daucus carota subsp. sativus TaxID=79200 RepID=A0A175YCN7_DAUCS|nr:hypothetical protein DCAR_0933294 [Daucus carota subsp. sativus]